MVTSRQYNWWLLAFTAFLAIAIFAVDLSLPLEVAGGVPYVALVLLGWWFPRQSHIFVLAAIGSLLTVVGYYHSPEGGVPWVVLANRGLALFAIWVTAAILARARAAASALETAHAEQTLIMRQMSDSVLTTDSNGEIIDWNPASEKMFGYRKDEVLGRKTGFLQRLEEPPTVAAEIAEGLKRDKRWTGEIIFVRKDGTLVLCDTTVVPFYGNGETPVSTVTVCRDVTSHKHAEEALHESKGRFRDLIEGSIQGVLIQWEFKPLFANQAYANILGYANPEEILACGSFLDLCAPREHERLERYNSARIAGAPAPDVYEFEGLRKDGTAVWLENRVRRVVWQGQPAIQSIVIDITERKRAEEALRESEGRLRAILEHAIEGIITIDEKGIVKIFNNAAERIFGYGPEEIIGNNIRILMPEPHRSKHDGYLEDYLRTGHAKIIGIGREVMGRRKDGKAIDLELGINELWFQGQRVFVGTIRDLTERNRLEDQLRQAQKMESLGRLAGSIAHDFNNILLPIITITEITRDELPGDGNQSAQLKIVLQAARRGQALVDQILKFSRRQPKASQPVDVAPVVREAAVLGASTLPAGVEIRPRIQEGAIEVLADPDRIHEVVLNLVTNAAHAIGAGQSGTIEVALRKTTIPGTESAEPLDLEPGNYAHLSVTDDGKGMDQDTLEHILEPFFTTKPTGQGTGMGLAVVHGIVTDAGGAITVSSKPGQGTAFNIYLPTRATSGSLQRL